MHTHKLIFKRRSKLTIKVVYEQILDTNFGEVALIIASPAGGIVGRTAVAAENTIAAND